MIQNRFVLLLCLLQYYHNAAFYIPFSPCKKLTPLLDANNNTRLMQYVCEMVESNILYDIYEKLFSHMVDFHQDDEALLFESCDKLLDQLPISRFGFDTDLEGIIFRDSLQVLNSINDFKTP